MILIWKNEAQDEECSRCSLLLLLFCYTIFSENLMFAFASAFVLLCYWLTALFLGLEEGETESGIGRKTTLSFSKFSLRSFYDTILIRDFVHPLFLVSCSWAKGLSKTNSLSPWGSAKVCVHSTLPNPYSVRFTGYVVNIFVPFSVFFARVNIVSFCYSFLSNSSFSNLFFFI